MLTALDAATPGRPECRHLLACCLREQEPATPEARRRPEDILEGLCEEYPDVPEYRHDLCELYADVSPDDREAEGRLLRALANAERLSTAHPGVPAYRATQVHVRHKLAVTLRRAELPGEAETHLRRAVELQTSLAGDAPPARFTLTVLRNDLAELLCERKQTGEAAELLAASAGDLEAPGRAESESEHRLALLADTYTRLARAWEDMGMKEQAAEARRRAESLRGGQVDVDE